MDGVSGHCLCALDRRGNHLFRPDFATRISWLEVDFVGPGVGGRAGRYLVRGVHAAKGGQWYPVVAASFDHGVTFPQVTSLVPPDAKNWGDRDFIAVGPDGVVYMTWDYGPNRTSVTFICSASGSCAFGTGDLNVVMQKSNDGGS